MAFETKTKASFSDIISFCNETKSERGHSPLGNRSDVNIDTISLRSKSPINFTCERTWSSPIHKEALEFSTKKHFAVLNMIAEKNWKLNLRSKIETDLSDQVQQALAPVVSTQKKWSEKKKADRQKNMQIFKFNGLQQHKISPRFSHDSGGGSFKYIDANYLPQHRILAGGGDPFYPKDVIPRSLANIRLPRRNGLPSHAMYGLEDMSRMQKHASNIRGGLDVTLLDSHPNINFLSLPKPEGGPNGLRPLIPNVITYSGISLPNYGVNRRCFQMYTKEGMNNILSSRTRRGKLTHIGQGKYMDKRGVIISRLGPFWPQGYGPVCQCPEFISACPKDEKLVPVLDKQKNSPDNGVPASNTMNIATSGNNLCLTKSKTTVGRSDTVHNNQSSQSSYQYNHHATSQASPRDSLIGSTTSTVGLRQGHDPIGRQQGHGNNPGNKQAWRGKPVIYDSERSSRTPLPHSVPDGMDESLVFESRFESGNLRQVRRIAEHEYELVLRTDMYTNRHTQWYYFRIQKAKPRCKYKINIINFLKKDSLYNYGMKPLIYSEKLASSQGLGWHRSGESIKYAAWSNSTRNAILSLDLQYYCLEFEVSFDWDEAEGDTIYLAHCYPYTYSDLRRHLDQMMTNPEVSQHVKKEVLCETTAGNACFLLTITEFPDREKDKYKDFHQGKRGVVITARVHPGESQASWMMKGVLDYLTSNHPSATQLREKFVFKIVPMLNPDGVIVGNYRTSLSARDLNRNYRHPKQTAFPTVWYTKQMVDQFNKDHPIVLYCDLHGHSRKHMVFMYGCERKAFYNKPKKTSVNVSQPDHIFPPYCNQLEYDCDDSLGETRDFVEERLFPWLMHRLAPTRFAFHETKFAVRKTKESTGRVVMFRQMGIWNSFTLEASFSGTKLSEANGRHFNIDDFQLIGRKLCDCVLEYSRVCEDPIAKSRAVVDMTRDITQQLMLRRNMSINAAPAPALKQPLTADGKTVEDGFAVSSGDNIANGSSSVKGKLGVSRRLTQNIGPGKDKQVDQQNIRLNIQQAGASNVNKNGVIANHVSKPIRASKNPGSDSDVDETQDAVTRSNRSETQNLDMNCLRLLKNLNIHDMELESETSSESNSDSEPELPTDSSARGKGRRIQANSGGARKKKRKKRQQKFGKSVSAPSNIQPSQGMSKKMTEESSSKDARSKQSSYPGFVNKYANRSNGGIPIFAQERIKERAARRLAELKLAEEDRKQQESQLRQQLLMSGIQDGPNVDYEIPVSTTDQVDNDGYSEICGVRYKVGNQPRRVHYMLYNPYRGQSPDSNESRQRMVTMRFSPPNQLRHNRTHDASQPVQWKLKNEQDLYTPYRVQAPAGRLSNQRGLSSWAEMSGDTSPGSPTEPLSSHSSERLSDDEKLDMDDNDVVYQDGNSPAGGERFEPRSVVVPLQKYNLAFKMYKKPWNQKPNLTSAIQRRPPPVVKYQDVPVPTSKEQEVVGELDSTICHPNVSELFLPPSMDEAEVMTAHMRYPGQVHRVEAMRPLPRGRTISRGPPMVFGEPVVMNQKPLENGQGFLPQQLPSNGNLEKSLVRSTSFQGHKRSNQLQVRHHQVSAENFKHQSGEEGEATETKSFQTNFSTGGDHVKLTGTNSENNQFFMPRFEAIAPPRGSHTSEENDASAKGNLTDRTSKRIDHEPSPQPFTVR
ncbi:uncharacterized protein LOC143445595 isoform X1 [Clavelina lepadiformis]|uniref:uncharacterized protein LOC143445595 isoform X1 n=1 Tax=Clavelina lepadiformis TaxID=159417 RepID=UPI0040424BA6